MSLAPDKASLLATFDEVFDAARNAGAHTSPRFDQIVKPKRSAHRILYLPVEIKARELASKALIARAALERGFNVIMGATWVMNGWSANLPPGIALFKSSNAMDARNMAAWVDHGHLTAVLDEEVFGIDVTREYLLATMHPHVAALADVICAQGKNYAAAFPYPANIHITGNPRTLTYGTSRGDDILVCLQSGNINHTAIKSHGLAHVVEAVLNLSAFPLSTPEGARWADIFRSSIVHECDMLPLVHETIDALANAFPHRRIRVRPHPIEDPSLWTCSQPNVVLDGSGGIVDVLKSAGTVVFVSGCTTGLDAYLGGVPAVRLGSGGHGISAHMHVEVNTADEAVAAVRRAEKWNGNLESHFSPADVMTPLFRLYKENQATGEAALTHGVNYTPQAYQLQKFPETSADEVSALIGRPVRQMAWNTWFV